MGAIPNVLKLLRSQGKRFARTSVYVKHPHVLRAAEAREPKPDRKVPDRRAERYQDTVRGTVMQTQLVNEIAIDPATGVFGRHIAMGFNRQCAATFRLGDQGPLPDNA
jgi:hypothetical protein